MKKIYTDGNGGVSVKEATENVKGLIELDPNKIDTFKLWCGMYGEVVNDYKTLQRYSKLFGLEANNNG